MKIYVTEDNPLLFDSLMTALKRQSYSIMGAKNGQTALEEILSYHDSLDLIILDVMLPSCDGFSICDQIRSKGIQTPVLFLTAKWTVEDRIKGLDLGGDDYLVKPFSTEELLARIRALLRRKDSINDEVVELPEGIIINLSTRQLTKDQEELHVTPKEFGILEYLVRHEWQALSQQQIYDHVFDFAKENWSNTIEVHIKNLRKKVFSQVSYDPIKTVRGLGYRLEI